MSKRQIPSGAALDNKVAVVTGGGRGIGRATARVLARAGARVMVTARSQAEIDETAEQIRQENGTAQAWPADVSDWEAMERLAAETESALGPADIVVANAGVINPVDDTWMVDPAAWAQNLRINLTGAFFTVRAFLPAMVARGSGTLIFVSSGAATHPVPGWSAYCAAKAGLDHFVRNLAAEIEERAAGLRVHALYPGVVATSMQQRIREKRPEEFSHVERYRRYHERGVLRPPEEPATLLWWLATSMAAEFHGQIVSIDDARIRQRIARDLDREPFKGRGE